MNASSHNATFRNQLSMVPSTKTPLYVNTATISVEEVMLITAHKHMKFNVAVILAHVHNE